MLDIVSPPTPNVFLVHFCTVIGYSPQAIVFLNLDILVGMKFYFLVDWICISLMINDVEHLFMFIGQRVSSLEKCLFRSFVHLKTGLLWGGIRTKKKA